MTTTITATSGSDQVTAFHFSQYVFVQRSFLFGTVSIIPGSDQNDADASEPYNGIVEGFNSSAAALSLFNQLSSEMLDIAARFPPLNSPFGQGIVTDYFELFNDTAVDYSNSNLKIFVDMEIPVQHGGFAEGDVLTDVFEVTGSAFDDVIRGSNTSDYPPDSTPRLVNGTVSDLRLFFTLHNPGDNVLNGGGGDDVLEGRGGADVLNGGSGLNYASYESSPAAVTVRLAGVVSDPQTFLATGGDAAGDTFSAIQGLLGSAFDDSLTGNSQNNVLAGGLGSDTLDGKGGTDTVDYSHDHFSDIGTTADKVVVHLGPNGTSGTGAEFDAHVDIHTLTVTFTQVSTDTLISIENVIGTNGPDEIIGNEQANTLDGRQGNDTLDGGLGNDTLIGGPGIDTVSYVSHDNVPLLLGEANNIKLGLNGAAGSYTRSGIVSVVPLQFQTVETDVLNGIENVTGSNHSETIIGNEQANTLDGRQGNDTLNGGLGNDTLKGGDGDDTYDFRGSANFGSDIVSDSTGFDTFLINSLNDLISSTFVGNDLITVFTTGTTRIIDDVNHPIERTITSDGVTVVMATGSTGGGAGGILSGTDGNDVLDGRGGDDWLYGDGGNDRLIGGTGNDHLLGGAGNDVLEGDEGDDVLNGGPGNNRLIGGAGNDVFVVAPVTTSPGGSDKVEANHTTIEDFVSGQDHIDLTAFHTSFDALIGDHGGHPGHGDAGVLSLVTEGHDSVLTFEGGTVRIVGVAHMHATDFLFDPPAPAGTIVDMILRHGAGGLYENDDIGSNAAAGLFGRVGTEWQVAGFGPGNGTADMVVKRDDGNNVFTYGLYHDIKNNQLNDFSIVGMVGSEWNVVGFADLGGAGTSDMIVRRTGDNATGVYHDINDNWFTDFTMGAGAAMGNSNDQDGWAGSSNAQLVQAMAGFGDSGAADDLNTVPISADTSQQEFLTTPRHV